MVDFSAVPFCLRSSWAAIQATAAPSYSDDVEDSKLRNMEISDWQCGQLATWAAALGSEELSSMTRSRTSGAGHSLLAATASCQIFALFVLPAMLPFLRRIGSPFRLLLSIVLQPGPAFSWR